MSQSQKLRTPAIAAGRDYQELPAWQKAMDLAEAVYSLQGDMGSLAPHMKDTALSIAASIAAASGRNNEFGMTDSYSKAQSANAELMTQLILAKRLGLLEEETTTSILAMADEVGRLIVGLKHGMKVAAKDKENAEKDAANEERARKAERDDRPRREYKPRDRDGDDRPRREYKPRDRDGEDRPRREYKPRDGAGADRGERKPYGDKKPYGDRKPRGDKPFRKPRD